MQTDRRWATLALWAVAIPVIVAFAFPFFWMLSTSLKSAAEATAAPPTMLPSTFEWGNYAEATKKIPFWNQALNSLRLCVLNVLGTVGSCALVAYGFARIQWPMRDTFFWLTLSTMMIPGAVLLVPLYGQFRALGWVGTSLPLWVPAYFASAYNIFLLRQFFLTIPNDITEAAEIDGCSDWQVFTRVILPLTKPALLVVGLFSFLWVWNDFMGPLVYLVDERQHTLSLGLQAFQSKLGGTEIHYLMAASTLMMAPVLALFVFAQRYFIEGIALSGVKA